MSARTTRARPGHARPAGPWIAALLAAGCGAGAGEPRSALLVTLDTTRADALACYGGLGTTPNLDRLAAEGVRFEAARTVAPITLPAHASMLTGLYPLRHGLRDNGVAALPGSAETLAERAREAGFQTAAFVASIVLERPFGLDQGFDVYEGPRRSEGGGPARALHGAESRADQVAERALEWFAGRDRGRPFFLWVHFYDPHHPYDPPAPFAGGEPYLGEVAAVDAQIGRLREALEADGALEETTLLLVADHGEAFGEHGESSHSTYCYDSTLAVPLILRAPDRRRAGERSRDIVTVTDVFPTLAGAMGLARPGDRELDGLDLWGPIPADRGVYFESYTGYFAHGWSPLSGYLDARGKYVHSSEPEFFEPAADPGEERDLFARDPERAAPYLRAIAALDALPKLEAGAAEIDEQLMASIQQLGYLGLADSERALPGPAEASELPSPRSRARWFVEYARARELVNAGRLDQAAEVFLSILEENPANYTALEELGGLRFRQARFEEAVEAFARLTRSGPQRGRHHFSLGQSLLKLGRLPEARAAIERAVVLSPRRDSYARLLRELDARLRPEDRQEQR